MDTHIKAKLDRFARAFATDCGGLRRTCDCGREFYDSMTWGGGWEEGELEKLQEDKKAVDLQHTVGTIEFTGKEYVQDCNCWHAAALGTAQWLDTHAHSTALYLNGEKAHLQQVADAASVVD